MRPTSFVILASFVIAISTVAYSQSTPASGSVTVSGNERVIPAAGATQGTGSFTMGGFERSFKDCTGGGAPSQSPLPCTTTWDSGTVSVTVNGFTRTVGYGQNSTPSTLASGLASAFNSGTGSPVSATLAGATVYLTSKASGASSNYPLSTSGTDTSGLWPSPGFFASLSGSTLTGGKNANSTIYDAGTVTVTVTANGTTYSKSTSYGQGSTSSSLVQALATAIQGDSTSPVTASAPSGSSTLTLTTQAVGWNVNYSFSSSSATTNSNFSGSSFSTSDSGATLTGGTSVPKITSLSASGSAEGGPLTVNGMGFATTNGGSTVALNGAGCPITSWSDTAIQIVVPSPAYTGNVVATVNGTASNGVPFTVAPTITSLSVSQGNVGTPVTVNGRNFGSSTGAVSFNANVPPPTAGASSSWSTSAVGTSVPTGALTGTIVITANGLPSNGQQFTVAPQITSISPNPIGPGRNVAVNGANFNSSQGAGTITFNGTAPTVAIWGDTGIAAIVPSTFQAGSVTVVVNQNGMTSASGTFTVVAVPAISGLSQGSGSAGANISISGSNFGSSGTVYFNWTPATNVTWGTTIQATVPPGATSGPVVVQNTGGASVGVQFNVNPASPTTSKLGNENTNNTSASSTFGGLADYRTTDTTTTFSPKNIGQTIVTTPFDVVMNNSGSPVNVATGRFVGSTTTPAPTNIRTLLYSGFSGKILAETQEWFCMPDSGLPITTFDITYDPIFLGGAGQNKHDFAQCGSHLEVGYDSDDIFNPTSHGQLQVDMMYQRGFDGFIADTSGYGFDCLASTSTPFVQGETFNHPCLQPVQNRDNAIHTLATYSTSAYPNPPGSGSTTQPMFYSLMEDENAFSNQCWSPDANQPLCIAQKIEADIAGYVSEGYLSNNYLKGNDGLTPLLAFFVDVEQPATIDHSSCSSGKPCMDLSFCNTNSCTVQSTSGGTTTCTGSFTDTNQGIVSTCWTSIWQAIAANSSPKVAMIFRNAGGFQTSDFPTTAGSFGWVNTNAATGSSILSCTQNDWKSTPNDPQTKCPDTTKSNYVDSFYAAAKTAKTNGMVVMGIAKKGFDKEDAPFGATLTDTPAHFNNPSTATTSQQCGQVWLDSFAEPSASGNFGSGAGQQQLDYMIVGTWDDYEEGSEIETGIDNCLSVPSSMTGSIFNFKAEFSGPSGSEVTLHHYDLFDADSAGNLTALYSEMPTNGLFNVHSVDLNTLNLGAFGESTLTLYLKAAGQPSILNHLSPPVMYSLGHGNAYVVINPTGPAPSDTGSVGVNVYSGSTQICSARTGFLAHRPLDSARNVASHLAQAINQDTTCSTLLSATSYDNGVVYLSAKGLGSATNYTFLSVSTGLSFVTVDSYGGHFLGGQ